MQLGWREFQSDVTHEDVREQKELTIIDWQLGRSKCDFFHCITLNPFSIYD